MAEGTTILRWRRLYAQWAADEQLARKAQGDVRIALEEFMAGGLRPSAEQFDRMDALRVQADTSRNALDALIIDVMQ